MKRKLKILLVLLLLVPFVACKKETVQIPEEPDIAFNEYTRDFVANYYSESDYGINFDFEHPENYGITKGLYAFEGYTEEDYNSYMSMLAREISYLKSFDYEKLNKDQRWTYDIILDYLEREYGMKDYFYYEAKGFGSITGINSNLPLIFDEYVFNDRQDVDSYINLLITSKVMFESYIGLEFDRQEKGIGLSQATIDSIIEQCDTILNTRDYFLEESFNKKIDAVDFLTNEEKETYKQLNKEHLYGEYFEAFQLLKDSFLTIDGSNSNEMPLAKTEDGLAYYGALIKRQLGIDTSPEDLITYLEKEIDELISQHYSLRNKHGEALFIEYPYLSSANNTEDVVNYLYEAFKDDFPHVDKSELEIKTVDESMQESFSPAAYLVTKFDTPVTAKEVILINGLYADADFTTYAHEGYPGHLYQTVYYKSLDLDMVNYILSNIGYTEGWAVYTELYSLKYSELPEEIKEFTYINAKLNNAIFCLFELKIHYEGLDKQGFYNLASEYFVVDQEWTDEFYDLIVEIPSYCLYYNLSYLLIEDAKEKMAAAYGKSFTDYQFHEFVLEHGNGSIGLLLKKLEEELKK